MTLVTGPRVSHFCRQRGCGSGSRALYVGPICRPGARCGSVSLHVTVASFFFFFPVFAYLSCWLPPGIAMTTYTGRCRQTGNGPRSPGPCQGGSIAVYSHQPPRHHRCLPSPRGLDENRAERPEILPSSLSQAGAPPKSTMCLGAVTVTCTEALPVMHPRFGRGGAMVFLLLSPRQRDVVVYK